MVCRYILGVVYTCDNVLRADRKAELKKLNHSILICFLELLDVLINNPASPAVRLAFSLSTFLSDHVVI